MAANINQGVFFQIADYAGILRRFLIIGVDLVCAIALCAALSLVTMWIPESDLFVFLGQIMICWVYLALLKSTSLGTIGYRLAGVRLIDLHGNTAAIWRSTFRVAFLALGPINLLVDILWLGGDPNRQSIRDKFAGTYVIRRNARPMGTGPIVYKRYFLLSYNLIFAEVLRTAEQTGQKPNRATLRTSDADPTSGTANLP